MIYWHRLPVVADDKNLSAKQECKRCGFNFIERSPIVYGQTLLSSLLEFYTVEPGSARVPGLQRVE